MTTALEQPPSANNRNPELDPGDGSVETPQLPERMILPLDVGNLVKIIEDLAENSSLLTHQDKKIVEQLYIKLGEGWLKAKLDLEHILAEIRFNSSVNQAGIASFKERKKAEQNPITLRLQRAASLLLAFNMLLAACSTKVEANPPIQPTAAGETIPFTKEPVEPVVEQPTPTEPVPSLSELEIDYGRYSDEQEGAQQALQAQWEEISQSILRENLALPFNIKIVDISATNALIEALQTGREDDYPEGTTFTRSYVKGFEYQLLTVTLSGANEVLIGNPATQLAISVDELPAALDKNGQAVAYVDKETGQWTAGSVELAPEVVENTAQTTATPEEESFAEPTLDNVEISERWATNQFPLEGNLADGPLRYYLRVVNDEIVTGKAEIMSPDGQGTGIYLIAGAETWYREADQDYVVLTPVAITDHQQTVKAGFAIQDYDPRLEQLATEITWNSILGDAGFTGRGHIFVPTITGPRHDKGTNQGLGNEELGAVYTQELIEQFGSGNGDPSMLPYVVIDNVKYYVLPPFDIGMVNTLNR
jgi:hypothetical protein